MSKPKDSAPEKPADAADDLDAPGEGNRAADRRYREATERFVAGGNVDKAADEARRAVDDESQREDLESAEAEGRSRAKEHDPEVRRR